jgi:hypothetical protein
LVKIRIYGLIFKKFHFFLLNSDTDDKLRSKQLLNLPLRSSPRLNKSKVLSNETPKKSNGIHYVEDEPSNEDDDSIKMSKLNKKVFLIMIINKFFKF